MIVFCDGCGFQKEIEEGDFRREICPKCSMSYLRPDKGRKAVPPVAETSKETATRPAEDITNLRGQPAINELVRQGKTLEETYKIMAGRLTVSTIRCYYSYAKQGEKQKKVKTVGVKPALPIKQHGKTRIINIEAFEDFISDLKNELGKAPETEATAGALIVIAQISGMLRMLKKEIYMEEK